MPRVGFHTPVWFADDADPDPIVSPQELGYAPYDAWQRDVQLSATGRQGDGFLTREELRQVIDRQQRNLGLSPGSAFAVRESQDMLQALERRNANAIAYLPPVLHNPELPNDAEMVRRVRENGVTKGSVRARATELLTVAHELNAGHEISQRVLDGGRARVQDMRRRGDITERTADRAMLEIEIIARCLNLA